MSEDLLFYEQKAHQPYQSSGMMQAKLPQGHSQVSSLGSPSTTRIVMKIKALEQILMPSKGFHIMKITLEDEMDAGSSDST